MVKAKFAHNYMVNRSIDQSPFSIVYTKSANHTMNLVVIHKKINRAAAESARDFRKMLDKVRDKLVVTNKAYKQQANKHQRLKQFNEGDLVMIHLCKERFLDGSYS